MIFSCGERTVKKALQIQMLTEHANMTFSPIIIIIIIVYFRKWMNGTIYKKRI